MHTALPPAHLLAAWLLRAARRRQLPVRGCWYQEQEEWAWLGTGGQTAEQPPPAGPTALAWEAAGLVVESSAPLAPGAFASLRRSCLRRAQTMQRRRLLRCFLQTLSGQREQLGHHLHKGPCQTLTAAQLQIGLVQLSDGDTERQDAETDLFHMVEQSADELRRFYESRLYRYPQSKQPLAARWTLDWERLSPDPLGQRLFFELLVAGLDWDPSVSAQQNGAQLRLAFSREKPGKVPALKGLLELFLLLGYSVRAGTRRVVVGSGPGGG